MIKVKNGSMDLFCIKGYTEAVAVFLRYSDGELILASGVKWIDKGYDTEVTWGSGKYLGPLANHINAIIGGD
jgi:hypothetical protein